MEDERRARYDRGDYSNHGEPTLGSLWRDLTMALRDCTYRIPYCKGCIEDIEHTGCTVEE
jgi:hypothetical protein